MSGHLRLSGRDSELADGLTVRRVLPAAGMRSVGPFVFFDQFGPVALKAETDSDVGAHPHIGLATVSYRFDGSLLHRDLAQPHDVPNRLDFDDHVACSHAGLSN